MGLSRKSSNSSSNSSGEGWGMGFLLVFFPDEEQQEEISKKKPTTHSNFNLFSNSSSSILPLSSSILKRTNSSQLLQKAQSTISICLLLLFTTLLLFTLSTLPSSSSSSSSSRNNNNNHYSSTLPAARRRYLSSTSRANAISSSNSSSHSEAALQGMGSLYTRGTRAMNNLIVAHAVESLTLSEFKLFLRLLHRSGLTSRSDLLFIFPTKTPKPFHNAILQENRSFFKLLTHEISNNNNLSSTHKSSFDVTQFVKSSKKDKESGEPIWGRRTRANFSETESTRPSYGSVVGFDVEELDPENSLSGFLDSVPMNLRRWACYPMLLGRVRRNFKHVMLVDMKEILLLGDDQLVRVRSQSPESVLLSLLNKHVKKSSDKRVNPGIITGGLRGVRRLSNAMLTGIVRATMQKRKSSVTESGLLSQMVSNEFVLKSVNLIVSTESVPELGSVIGANLKTGTRLFSSNHSVIRRGNSNLDVDSVVIKHICSFPLDSKVYSEC